MKFSIIIPVYNEAKTLEEIIRRVQATGLVDEILAVDDGSTDGSRELLEKLSQEGKIKTIYHDHNQGKGKAVRTGILNASGDLMLIQDADLEYDPRVSQPAATDPGRDCGCCIWLKIPGGGSKACAVLEYGRK